MLTLIHGDNIAASRTYFIDMKMKFPDTSIHDGKNLSLTDLMQILEGGDLFNDEKVLFIENFFSAKKQSTEIKTLLPYLTSQSENATIVLWEDKELDKKTLLGLKDSTVRLFKLPQPLFSFLESLRPGNSKILIKLFHTVLQTIDEEMVFYMLIRHIRLLLAHHGQIASIDEIKRMQDWQRMKLIKQAKLFSEEQLITIYKKLYEIEKGIKTGSLTLPLASSIDIFLLEL